MRVLVVIISSYNNPVYRDHKEVWRKYMNSHPAIDAYFLEYHETKHRVIEDNTLYLKGKESYCPGIRDKTLDCFEYIVNNTPDYDFIVRTNLSSLWNFTTLIDYISSLPTVGVYNGIRGIYNGVPFVSGSGFIMTKDVVQLLVRNRSLVTTNILDDVDIAIALQNLGVAITLGSRKDLGSVAAVDRYRYDKSIYHYRMKMDNEAERKEEPALMIRVLSMF
jgi:hypothetical protein